MTSSSPRQLLLIAVLGGLALLSACNRRDQEPTRDLAPPGADMPASPVLPSSSPTT